jgi:hypothetical protein
LLALARARAYDATHDAWIIDPAKRIVAAARIAGK